MRAREFIEESKIAKSAKISKRQQVATRGLNKVTDGDRWNSDYKLYRLGLALAACDGVNLPDVDAESWVGRWKTVHPYSKEEQDMLNLAYKAVNAEAEDVNNGDMKSEELPDTYTVSPVSNWMNTK